MRHAEEMLHASESFEERLRETEKRYTARFSSLRTELHLRVKTEVNNVFKFEIKLLTIRHLLLVMKMIMIFICTLNLFSMVVFVLFLFEVFIGNILSIKDLTCYRST